MAHRCILVLLDGLGDRSYPFLNHQTPLQAAHTPNLDKLASIGSNGLFHAERLGLALSGENAHFAMFGYGAEEFPGRGYLEALGAGIEMGYDEVALLTHFVTLREEGGVLHVEQHRPEASEEEIEALVEAVRDFSTAGTNVCFHHTKALDGVLTLCGDVSIEITDTDPLQTNCPMIEAGVWRGAKDLRAADKTAWTLNAYLSHCYHLLDSHPVNRRRRVQGLPLINGLVTQRAGRRRNVESFGRRWGLKGLSISSGVIHWGLATYIGMEVTKVTDSNNPGADLARRLEMALAPDSKYQFVHVHTKTPDAASHTKDARHKVEVIESLDAGLAPIMASPGDSDTMFVITADHSTPAAGPLIHSGEPVPILVVGSGARRDAVKRFDEIDCAGGALGNPRGSDLMPMVLNMLDMAKLRGIRDTINDQPYWPGRRTPFKLLPIVTDTDTDTDNEKQQGE